MRLRPTLTTALCALACMVAPQAAFANSFTDIFREYQQTGRIDPCKHSSKELKDAKRQVPNDIEQYAPDFPAALDAASAQRAAGSCGKKGSTSGTAAAPVAPTGTGGTGTGSGTVVAPVTQTPATAAPEAAAPTATPQPTPEPVAAAAAADGAIPLAARTDGAGGDTPAPLILLALFGGLLAIAGAGWGASRFWAWEPSWMSSFGHAGSEAGWRASATWSEFTDWVRMGR